ncbi:MAG: DUF4249 family protein [Bacteroidia bacterium]
MKHILLIFFLFLSLIQFSCMQTVPYVVPYAGDQLVINGILTNDSLIVASIYRTAALQEERDSGLQLEDARVELWVDDAFTELLIHTSEGVYQSANGRVAEEAHRYQLRVSHPNMPSAQTPIIELPTAPEFYDYLYRDSMGFVSNTPVGEITLEWANQDTLAWHTIQVRGISADQEIVAGARLQENWKYLYTDCGLSQLLNIDYLLPNRCFESDTIQVSWSTASSSLVGLQQFNIGLGGATEGLHAFALSRFNTPSGMDFAFANPQPSYTNIEGGWGIWGAVNVKWYTIDL